MEPSVMTSGGRRLCSVGGEFVTEVKGWLSRPREVCRLWKPSVVVVMVVSVLCSLSQFFFPVEKQGKGKHLLLGLLDFSPKKTLAKLNTLREIVLLRLMVCHQQAQ